MDKSFIVDNLIITFIGFVLIVGWWKIYVEPSDKIRYAIMDCMGEDMSEQAYNLCVENLK